MKKLFILALAITSALSAWSQDSTGISAAKKKKKSWSNISLSNRANDHLMVQIGYNGWLQKTDTLKTKGIPRTFNVYFMYDFPFKSDPRFSVGAGVGVGVDNVYFNKLYIDITGKNVNRIDMQDQSNGNHFKRFKLATTYLEIPVELRFALNPENTNKSWKFAVGGKIGTLLGATAKGKILQNQSGGTVDNYTLKEKSNRYFNSTRICATARISKGVFGVFASYQINDFIKSGYGPAVKPFQVGLVFSGL